MNKIKLYLYWTRNILLMPLTLFLAFLEWYHFKISNDYLVDWNRRYRKWLLKYTELLKDNGGSEE